MEKSIKRKQKNDNCLFLPPSFHVRKWKKVWVEEGAYPKFKWVPINQPYPTPIPPEFLESNNNKNTPITTRRSYRLSLKDDRTGETPREDTVEE